MKTYSLKASDLRPQWLVVDAAGQPLGRLASRVAQLLRGKHKPIYSPHMNTGDFVIVINSRHVRVTGNKSEKKIYYRHTQYPGGLRETPFSEMITKHPTRVVERAVKGMLPHNRLGRQMLRRLKLFPDADHPHQAQVNASIKAAEKVEREGPVWIGLPKPVIRRRVKKKRAKAPVAEAPVEVAAEPSAPAAEEPEGAVEQAAAAETAVETEVTQPTEAPTEEAPAQAEAAVESEGAAAEVEPEQPAELPTAEAPAPAEEAVEAEPTEAAEAETRLADEQTPSQQNKEEAQGEPEAKKETE